MSEACAGGAIDASEREANRVENVRRLKVVVVSLELVIAHV